ncbi:non-ribosomal peptide synthetase [Lewinella sp. 4G2]|uniref:non-ribosomal peptide synthetase n=1 Tax=Lewinella sp. 4G2 TaxID=1803372 RepID=UPI0007B4F36A|nr:non-ribosomal peptide synthetase [Lewinella sp. 4G2]OAV43679.1 hypothetical protein A3850_003830 [Lewinella sp. 4G2]
MSKPSALQRWLKRKQAPEKPEPGPVRSQGVEENASFPLTATQHRLWVLSTLNPESSFYHYAETYGLTGNVDPVKLRAAFRAVVSRHAILRATFHGGADGPYQKVGAAPEFEFTEEDLRGVKAESRPAALQDRCHKIANRPFDLTQGPLLRVALLRMADTEWTLLLVLHHIVFDFWSLAILRRELTLAYRGEILPPLQLQYPELGLNRKPTKESDLAWWKEQLRGLPPALNLPTDRPRPASPSYRGAYAYGTIHAADAAAIRRAARGQGVTLYTYLLAAYQVLLARFSGTEDFAIGAPVTTRDRQELEELIGFFDQTLTLRSSLTDGISFRQLVERVKASTTEAFLRKSVPFEEVVQAINPPRLPGANPLFQHMLVLKQAAPDEHINAELELHARPFDAGIARFDQTLFVADTGQELEILLEYATDLFDADTIQRYVAHFITLLQEVTLKPDAPLETIRTTPEAEYQQLTETWNATCEPLPAGATITSLIAEHVESAHTAVSAGNGQLTYRELKVAADRLSRQLDQSTDRDEEIIGLYLGPVTEMAVALLATLQSGYAYLPLDPSYPADRINYLIEDSGVRTILTTPAFAAALELPAGIRVLHVGDNDAKVQESTSSTSQIPTRRGAGQGPRPEDLAYVIYTSGSTGKPKGVPVTHANLVHSTLARRSVYPSQPTAFLLLSSFSFDSSVAGIFWALTSGAKLVLAPRRIEQDLDALASLIANEAVSHTLMLPTLYETVLRFSDAEELGSLRTVIVAGEACTAKLVKHHFATLPSAELFNEYGPTEATVWCTAHQILPEDATGAIPIGRPIPNATAYVMAKGGRALAPLGVPGELYIGGAGVTAGYRGRPELTAEKFVASPFGKEERLYRTGDLARHGKDGQLYFLGRVDRQIKLRGYRIELGEVREALLFLPGVTEAAVRVDQERQRLLGYVAGVPVTALPNLRRSLLERMPKHLVPAALHAVDVFPQLVNGKIDVASLPLTLSGQNRIESDTDQTELSPAAATLLEIWRTALKDPSIGANDNFFEVGGDSILSIQIVARARAAGLNLSPRSVFEHQTVAEMARNVGGASLAASPQEFSGPFPLHPIQSWFFTEHRAAPHHWNQGVAVRVPGQLTSEQVTEALHYLVGVHHGLRQQFHQSGAGEWEARIVDNADAPVYLIPEGINSEEAIQDYLQREQSTYPLENTPLFRGHYSPAASTLYLLAHHLVVDVVTWRILLEDLGQLWQQLNTGSPLHLAPATAPYGRYARQLAERTEQGVFSKEISFWKDQQFVPLPGLTPDQNLSTEATTSTLELQLTAAETEPYLRAANEAYRTTTEELILAALVMAIGAPQLHLGLEHNGRSDEDADLTRSAGWFTAAYPLTLAGGDEPGAIIVATKEKLRSVPGNGVGYGALKYGAKVDFGPQPQLLFNYLGRIDSEDPKGAGYSFLNEDLRAPASERNRLWEINVGIFNDELRLSWAFDTSTFTTEQMQVRLASMREALFAVSHHCLTVDEATFSPSDFPEADLSQNDLDALFDQL